MVEKGVKGVIINKFRGDVRILEPGLRMLEERIHIPVLGVAILLGIDQILDMGRTTVNLIGNCVATVVIARWENKFDYDKMKEFTKENNLKLVTVTNIGDYKNDNNGEENGI